MHVFSVITFLKHELYYEHQCVYSIQAHLKPFQGGVSSPEIYQNQGNS